MSKFTLIMNLIILCLFLWISLKQDPGHFQHIFLTKMPQNSLTILLSFKKLIFIGV